MLLLRVGFTSTQLFINISIRFFREYGNTFRPILCHLQANILHIINYSCIHTLYVHRLKSQTVLKSKK